MFWAFILVFFSNEIGQRFSDAFERIECEVGQLKWYFYSIEMKRLFHVLFAIIQQPIAIQFFGSAVCGRRQFKKVHNFNFLIVFFEFKRMVFSNVFEFFLDYE